MNVPDMGTADQPQRPKSALMYGDHVRANGIRQHYLRFGGEGHPLVLVGGITSPAATWAFVAERLARVFDVYVVDVRGRGLSSTGPDLAYDLNTYADDLGSFSEKLGLKSYHLLGHSMGARIGVRVATRRPAGLDRLVLADPPVTGPGRRPYEAPLSWYLDGIRLAQEGGNLETLRAMSPTWTDDQVRTRVEWLPTCDPTAVTRSYEGFHTEDIHGDLAALDRPSLLVYGEKGVISPQELDEIVRMSPMLKTVRVSGAGHMIPFDNFEGFFEAIGDFLGPRP